MVELMRGARDLGHPADWLIRSKRMTARWARERAKLSAALQDAPVLALSNSTWQRAKACRHIRVRQQLRVLRKTELPGDKRGKVKPAWCWRAKSMRPRASSPCSGGC